VSLGRLAAHSLLVDGAIAHSAKEFYFMAELTNCAAATTAQTARLTTFTLPTEAIQHASSLHQPWLYIEKKQKPSQVADQSNVQPAATTASTPKQYSKVLTHYI